MPIRAPAAVGSNARVARCVQEVGGAWEVYEREFFKLMREREIETELHPTFFETPTVLLCSEATAECCHRRLVLEYLQQHWSGIEMRHL